MVVGLGVVVVTGLGHLYNSKLSCSIFSALSNNSLRVNGPSSGTAATSGSISASSSYSISCSSGSESDSDS